MEGPFCEVFKDAILTWTGREEKPDSEGTSCSVKSTTPPRRVQRQIRAASAQDVSGVILDIHDASLSAGRSHEAYDERVWRGDVLTKITAL